MKTIVICALAALAACSGYTITYRDGVLSIRLEFESHREDTGHFRPEPVVTAAGGAGQIVVDARLSAPSVCERLTAAAASPGPRTVELEVRIEPDGSAGCLAVIGNFAYTARLRGLEPGTYTVRVRHLYPGTGWPGGTVLETQVPVR